MAKSTGDTVHAKEYWVNKNRKISAVIFILIGVLTSINSTGFGPTIVVPIIISIGALLGLVFLSWEEKPRTK